MPTDENLMTRGCHLASSCSICFLASETTPHLFFECPYAIKIWSWLASLLNTTNQFTSLSDVWKISGNYWSPQCLVVIKSCVVNIISTIWFIRNQACFQNKQINWRIAINTIISNVSLSGNHTIKTSAASMTEFVIMKTFKVNIHPPKAPSIKEVIWQPPIQQWIKLNTDGAMIKNPCRASCASIFRDNNSIFKGGFAQNVETDSPFVEEMMAALVAIEIAFDRGWHNLWLETDSQLILLAFKAKNMIPCTLRNRWINCLQLLLSMNFFVTHIYREGNSCADSFANLGLAVSSLVWFPSLPSQIANDFTRNRLGLPNFRFSYFY